MRLILIALLSFAPLSAEAAPKASPVWLAGYWLSCERDTQTVEAWIGDGAGTLVGVNLSGGVFEHLRIAPHENAVAYFASPNGAAPTIFAMIEGDADSVVFENPAHDYPTRVIYRRNGDTLIARIAGELHGKTEATEWRFRSAPMGEQCE